MKRIVAMGLLAGALAGGPASASAQEQSELLSVGTVAPDIQVVGATRYGVLEETVRLSDYRGETVVLAFFFRVRTRG